jgi:hypothetical protein
MSWPASSSTDGSSRAYCPCAFAIVIYNQHPLRTETDPAEPPLGFVHLLPFQLRDAVPLLKVAFAR